MILIPWLDWSFCDIDLLFIIASTALEIGRREENNKFGGIKIINKVKPAGLGEHAPPN